jgi:hypothetical protein
MTAWRASVAVTAGVGPWSSAGQVAVMSSAMVIGEGVRGHGCGHILTGATRTSTGRHGATRCPRSRHPSPPPPTPAPPPAPCRLQGSRAATHEQAGQVGEEDHGHGWSGMRHPGDAVRPGIAERVGGGAVEADQDSGVPLDRPPSPLPGLQRVHRPDPDRDVDDQGEEVAARACGGGAQGPAGERPESGTRTLTASWTQVPGTAVVGGEPPRGQVRSGDHGHRACDLPEHPGCCWWRPWRGSPPPPCCSAGPPPSRARAGSNASPASAPDRRRGSDAGPQSPLPRPRRPRWR